MSLSIRGKSTAVCGALLAALAATAGLAVSSSKSSNDRLDHASSAQMTVELRSAIANGIRAERDFLLGNNPERRKAAAGVIDRFARERDELRGDAALLKVTASHDELKGSEAAEAIAS